MGQFKDQNDFNLRRLYDLLEQYISMGGGTSIGDGATDENGDALPAGQFQINWDGSNTYRITMTEDSTFTEINIPVDSSKVVTIYLDGAFTPTFPAEWNVILGSYDGAKLNQIVIEYVDPTLYWVSIVQDS